MSLAASPERPSDAPDAPPGGVLVLIYQMARQFEWVTWLCPDCLAKNWIANEWQVRGRKTVTWALRCDDCHRLGDEPKPNTEAAAAA